MKYTREIRPRREELEGNKIQVWKTLCVFISNLVTYILVTDFWEFSELILLLASIEWYWYIANTNYHDGYHSLLNFDLVNRAAENNLSCGCINYIQVSIVNGNRAIVNGISYTCA